ncbi:hypothetical protein BKA70DRAFT_1555629 [Coprinopsis sp. MPI-PUGE-AT-0042]|nr:hypothetical protein BKA70DRAFT_1555629 [Coprinopsis sp. MPI-PUGE-AT-0042]
MQSICRRALNPATRLAQRSYATLEVPAINPKQHINLALDVEAGSLADLLSRETSTGREAVKDHAARVAAITAKRRAMGLAAEAVSDLQDTQKKPEQRKPQPKASSQARPSPTGTMSHQASHLESQEERLARIRAGLRGFQSQETSGGQGQRSAAGSGQKGRQGGRKSARKQNDFEESSEDWDVPADVVDAPWFRADVAAPSHGNPAEEISANLSNLLRLQDPRKQPLIPGRGSRAALQRPAQQYTTPLLKQTLEDQARVAMSVSPVIPPNRKGDVASVLSKYSKK